MRRIIVIIIIIMAALPIDGRAIVFYSCDLLG